MRKTSFAIPGKLARRLLGGGVALTFAANLLCAQPQTRPIKRPKNNELAIETSPAPVRDSEETSALAAPVERLTFHVSPLSGTGTLSEQIREALKALDKANGNATFIKLRAFVAGTGDLRRVQSIVAETLAGKKAPLPVVTTIRVGGLGLDTAQVAIESISQESKNVNPAGLIFYPGQEAATVEESLAKLGNILKTDRAEAVRITCFAGSTGQTTAAKAIALREFPKAATVSVQSSRFDAEPKASCEGVARAAASASSTAGTIVEPGKVVFSAPQMAFGSQDSDAQLAYSRLKKSLESLGADTEGVISFHVYAINREAARAAALLSKGAGTVRLVEALPSLDATLAIEIVTTVK